MVFYRTAYSRVELRNWVVQSDIVAVVELIQGVKPRGVYFFSLFIHTRLYLAF